MITEDDLREALNRAAEPVTARSDAEDRLRGAAVAPHRLRAGLVVLVAAASVALVALVPSWLQGAGPGTGLATTALPSAGALGEGRYVVVDGFPDRISFLLGNGWRAVAAAPGDARLRPPGAPDGVVGLIRPAAVFGAGTDPVAAPRDLTTWLKTHPGLTVMSAAGQRVGTLVGTRLQLRAGDRPAVSGPCRGTCVALVDGAAGVLSVPAGAEVTIVSINDHGEFFLAYAVAPPAQAASATRGLDELLAGAKVPD